MLAWGFSVLGLIILLISGDALVKGAVNLSLRLGVPALIISLTIVAFGTSAPELLIAIQATLEDAPGLALGNVVGSNTANILLVLGVPALLFSLDTTQCAPRVTYLFMLFSSLAFIALAATGVFDVWQAAILLALLAVYLYKNFKDATDQSVTSECGMVDPDDELEGADPSSYEAYPRVIEPAPRPSEGPGSAIVRGRLDTANITSTFFDLVVQHCHRGSLPAHHRV